MYNPDQFREERPEVLRAFIAQHPLRMFPCGGAPTSRLIGRRDSISRVQLILGLSLTQSFTFRFFGAMY